MFEAAYKEHSLSCAATPLASLRWVTNRELEKAAHWRKPHPDEQSLPKYRSIGAI